MLRLAQKMRYRSGLISAVSVSAFTSIFVVAGLIPSQDVVAAVSSQPLVSEFSRLNKAAEFAAKEDKAKFERWAKITMPLPGAARSIGGYSAGCLAGAAQLPIDGNGYSIMRLSRNRYFGHPELITYLTDLGQRWVSSQTKPRKSELMLIGDLSPPRGGPMLTGHASHQTGLDVDIWLQLAQQRPSIADRENLSAPSYVMDRKKLRPNWSEEQVRLITAALNSEHVNRAFISPAIKKYFCQQYPKAPWLYKLRSWWGHDDHLHVRLNCTKGDTACQVQPALDPTDNSCGSELDWWLSADADKEWQKILADTSPKAFPALPADCEMMLK